VYVQPRHPDAATLEVALPRWLRQQADRSGRRLSLQVSADAGERQARYARAGLQYAHSIFQFRRPLTDVPEPVWPPGLAVADWAPERDARNVHALIRTAFSDVQGQPDRDWPTWSAAVLDRTDTDVLTVHDAGRLVGAAVLSSYDSYGHVRQLAVERSIRGSGLGKALLLASFHRFATRGLSEVRLGVYASNRTAQNLYEGVGMTLLTEWQVWMPPA
jgi:ribosomal protein S18 acetylase RimI-like enzyme